MKKFFNKELLYRALSVLIFVPLVILPMFISNYLTSVVFLIFLSIILIEINDMKKNTVKVLLINSYFILTVASFFLFLLLLITGEVTKLWLFYVIIVIWFFDTFSYVGGKLIGGTRLMPKISSGKTVSGLFSGVIMTIIVTAIIVNVFFRDVVDFSVVNVLLIIVISFIGDTLVSILKRYVSIKDTGNIMPGHGGLLDRFDSFIAVFLIIGVISLFL